MQKKICRTQNIFGQDVYFIVEHFIEDKTYDIAGVGNLVLYYPDDCEVPAYRVASQRIVDLSQTEVCLLPYYSDGSYSRTGTTKKVITPEFLQALILQGYHTRRVSKRGIDTGNLYLNLENEDYDMLIFLKDNQYYSKKMWPDGFARAHDIECLNTPDELNAVLAVLANHF